MEFFEDRKAQRVIDIVGDRFVPQQVNVNRCVNPFQTPEWHAHKKQEDVFFCIKGSFLIGLAIPKKEIDVAKCVVRPDEWDVKFVVLSDRMAKSLFIPFGWFHTYTALEPDSIIMFAMKEKYDPQDLYVQKMGSFGESWDLK